jgi:hypothetical protein
VQPVILGRARAHDVEDEDMLHAIRNPSRFYEDDDLTMVIRPARNAELLEIGVVDTDEGPVIVHAMSAREQFLR